LKFILYIRKPSEVIKMESYSYIRIFNAVPDAPPMDVYINGRLSAEGLFYKRFSQYLMVTPGPINLQIYVSGRNHSPVLDTGLVIPSSEMLTIAALGSFVDIGLLRVPEPRACTANNKVKLTLGHISPNAPRLDITLRDGTVIFKDVGFKEITNYIDINPGIYDLQIRASGTDKVLLDLYGVELRADNFYSIYAVGLVEESPALEGIISLDRICS